ncbi:hypothetical protein [Streptomyces sp. NPDC127197]|uniref:hypothetical protein n=1 Tax=Streptomyces sp. NPDC127197 TaxID=3345388 RepID=UPI00363CE2AC
MARSSHTVPCARGLGPAAVIAVLLAVLTAQLSPPAHGSTPPGRPDGVAAPAAVQAGSGCCSADDGHPAVCSAAARIERDTPGEHPSPSPATLALGHMTDSPPRSTSTPPTAVRPSASAQPTDRHRMRAPPQRPGT